MIDEMGPGASAPRSTSKTAPAPRMPNMLPTTAPIRRFRSAPHTKLEDNERAGNSGAHCRTRPFCHAERTKKKKDPGKKGHKKKTNHDSVHKRPTPLAGDKNRQTVYDGEYPTARAVVKGKTVNRGQLSVVKKLITDNCSLSTVTTPPPAPPLEPVAASPCAGRACGRSSP